MSTAAHCDGPGCDTWTRGIGMDGWLIVNDSHHFCGWGCLAAYAASRPWVDVIV